MGHARLDDYVREIREAARGRDDVVVLLGLEADHVPGHEGQLRTFLADHRFDYVVGGVREVGGFDVIAHLDRLGLWDHVPGPAVRGAIDTALDAIAASDGALELNTDRTSYAAKVMYPSDELLVAARPTSRC